MPPIIQTTTLRNNLSSVLDTIEKKRHQYFLITERGKKTRAAIVNLDFFEDLLALASPKYVKSIRDSRRQIKQGQYFTHQEVFGEL